MAENKTRKTIQDGIKIRLSGKPRQSIPYFDKALESDPVNKLALFNKGNALGRIGKYRQAINCYSKILEIEPNHRTSLLNMGLAYHYMTDYTAAVSCYDEILKNNPDDANVWYHKACSESMYGNYGLSLSCLRHAISLDVSFVDKAKNDIDFAHMRNNRDFMEVVKNNGQTSNNR